MKLKHRLYLAVRKLAVSTHAQTSLGKRKRKTRVKGKQGKFKFEFVYLATGFPMEKTATGYGEFVKSRRSLPAWDSPTPCRREKSNSLTNFESQLRNVSLRSKHSRQHNSGEEKANVEVKRRTGAWAGR